MIKNFSKVNSYFGTGVLVKLDKERMHPVQGLLINYHEYVVLNSWMFFYKKEEISLQ